MTADPSSLDHAPPAPADAPPLQARVEALLMVQDAPLSAGKLADLLGLTLDTAGPDAVTDAIASLNQVYEQTQRSFRIEKVAGGYRVMTLPEFGTLLERIRQKHDSGRLSQAALETLAVIAYRQPVTRADLEAIRGVACGEVLRGLLDRNLIRITGRAEEVGRPMLYGTTRQFLEVFGLSSIADLPTRDELGVE